MSVEKERKLTQSRQGAKEGRRGRGSVLPPLKLECRPGWVSIDLTGGTFHVQQRRHFSAEQKAQVVRRHLAGKEPVSNLADEFEIQPSQIHGWVKLVLDQAERAFDKAPGSRPRRATPRTAGSSSSRAKLVQKNEVIAELMEENVRAKKANGEL